MGGAGLPLIIDSIEPTLEACVPMRDRVRLATDVYLPDVRANSGRAPVILIRTPYDKRGVLDAAPQLAALFVSHGIGVVAQDVRGKFASEGAAAAFIQEPTDTFDCLEWLGAQSWFDGRVIAVGDSYVGFTAWCAAASGHPIVRGAVARATTTDIAEEWMYRQGLFRLQMNGGWTKFAFGNSVLPAMPSQDPDWSVRPLSTLYLSDGAGTNLLEFVARNPPNSREWRDHRLGGDRILSRVTRVPMLHWGGWWDLLARGQIRDWQITSRLGDMHQLVMSGTDHLSNHFSDDSDCDVDRGQQLQELYLHDALPFIFAILKHTTTTPGVRWELVHDGWRSDLSWPPTQTARERLYLADGSSARFGPEGGALVARSERLRTVVSWTHDPNDLVPSLETFVWGTLADLPDERTAQIRDDVMTFTSVPAKAPLDLAGMVNLHAVVHASARRAHVMATLCDVYPDGRTNRIAEGATIVPDADRDTVVNVDLGPVGYRVRPEHRLRLALASSSFPRYLWHTGTDEDPWEAMAGVSVELHTTLGTQTYLEFDVLCEARG